MTTGSRQLKGAPSIEIWSGGQTGVDRAALDVAIEAGIAYQGWVPRGRRAEDGPIPVRYEGLRETDSDDPADRTQRNVRDSDATLLIVFGEPTGGTALARTHAEQLARPFLVVDVERVSGVRAAEDVRRWLASLPRPLRLNVAGPRESKAPSAYSAASQLLRLVLYSEQKKRPA